MPKPRLIIANWKSQKTFREVDAWLSRFVDLMRPHLDELREPGKPQIVIAPPYPFVDRVDAVLRSLDLNNIRLGVQDLSPYPAGKYTGAVSVRNLEGWEIKYAIVGHSERRRYFKENEHDVSNKVNQAIESAIVPVVCLDQGDIQVQADAIGRKQLSKCVVAYEPVESIGTGLSQSVAQVLPVVKQIKAVFGDVPIIYGGSVTEVQVDEYLLATDGVLVGGASLDPNEFFKLVKKAMLFE